MALVLSLKGTDYSLKGTSSVPFRDNTRALVPNGTKNCAGVKGVLHILM